MKKDFFVVFEGIDNIGKTTLINRVEKILQKKGLKIFVTSQPGGSKLGKKLREVLLYEKLTPQTELLLFLADRHQHLKEVLLKVIKDYDVVICDRYFYSSFVYQGYFRKQEEKLAYDFIFDFHEKLNLFRLIPDLIFYLFTGWETWQNFQKKNYQPTDKITITNREGKKTLERMQTGYQEIFSRLGKKNLGKIFSLEVKDHQQEVLSHYIARQIYQLWKKKNLS